MKDQNNTSLFRLYTIEEKLARQGKVWAKIISQNDEYMLHTIAIDLLQSNSSCNSFIVPVGNGSVACSIAKSFAKYNIFPKFIGVQIEDNDPITIAWKEKSFAIKPMKQIKTRVSPIHVANPINGRLTLAWLENNNGSMLSVSENNIKNAQKFFVDNEGFEINDIAGITVAAMQIVNQTLDTNDNILLLFPENNVNGL